MQGKGEIKEGFLNEGSLIGFSKIGRRDVGGKAMQKKKQHEQRNWWWRSRGVRYGVRGRGVRSVGLGMETMVARSHGGKV